MEKEALFPTVFYSAGKEFNTVRSDVPAPYMRFSFTVKRPAAKAKLTVGAIGFYEAYVNGANVTKGLLAPYRSNPDHLVYYDACDVEVREGKNVLGLILGNGFQNPLAFNYSAWNSRNAWRSAPAAAFFVDVEYADGEKERFAPNADVRTCPSPIMSDDLHFGERYDSRNEVPDWNAPDFDDSKWDRAIIVDTPRGAPRFCEADPVTAHESRAPVSVTPYEGSFIYDFGVVDSGVCRLKIKGIRGQSVLMRHFEMYSNGKPYFNNIRFHENDAFQEDVFICSGGEDDYTPRFTYHGFRYVQVVGVTEAQATEGLLTFVSVHSDVGVTGAFVCDDETVNKINEATVRSDLSNIHCFPTDCPQREKNGWTADAALSAEQFFLNLSPEKTYREWLRSIYLAMRPDGKLPGIIPTPGWGYEWGNGPSWDGVIATLPYYTYVYRRDGQIIKEAATPLMRYLTYLYSRVREDGLIAIGLGDWCQPGLNASEYKTPLEVTDSISSIDIANKAAFIFERLSMPEARTYALSLSSKLRAAVREKLVDAGKREVLCRTQTGQAMAIYYGVFDEAEKPDAVKNLVALVAEKDGHMDTGVLGGRVIFRVLAENGYAQLAFSMITRKDFPSYGNWIARGATTLWEEFRNTDEKCGSHNHHFWGDVSAWFYTYLAGIRVKADGTLDVAPVRVKEVNDVKAHTLSPAGRIDVHVEFSEDAVKLTVEAPEGAKGSVVLPEGYAFADGTSSTALSCGVFTGKLIG